MIVGTYVPRSRAGRFSKIGQGVHTDDGQLGLVQTDAEVCLRHIIGKGVLCPGPASAPGRSSCQAHRLTPPAGKTRALELRILRAYVEVSMTHNDNTSTHQHTPIVMSPQRAARAHSTNKMRVLLVRPYGRAHILYVLSIINGSSRLIKRLRSGGGTKVPILPSLAVEIGAL